MTSKNLKTLIEQCQKHNVKLNALVEQAPLDAEYVSTKISPYARLKKKKDDSFFMVMKRGKWISSLNYKSALDTDYVKLDEIREYLQKQ